MRRCGLDFGSLFFEFFGFAAGYGFWRRDLSLYCEADELPVAQSFECIQQVPVREDAHTRAHAVTPLAPRALPKELPAKLNNLQNCTFDLGR
jgi:hypothetical protein